MGARCAKGKHASLQLEWQPVGDTMATVWVCTHCGNRVVHEDMRDVGEPETWGDTSKAEDDDDQWNWP